MIVNWCCAGAGGPPRSASACILHNVPPQCFQIALHTPASTTRCRMAADVQYHMTDSGTAVQALVDRHIPLYEYPPQQPAAIFAYKGSADNVAANELQYWDKSVVATGGYNSRAATLLAHMREPTPLPTMNVATRKAGPSLQLPAAAQGAAGNTA